MLEAIDSFKQDFDHSLFLKIHNERACELEDLALWQPSIQAVTEIRELTKRNFARSYGPVIRLGSAQDLSLEQQVVLKGAISTVMPWRKGPFELCGVEIDAEWRSDLKWERIRDCLDNPSGRIIADVGCNNGYYMFRLLEKHAPKLVLGLDPSPRCFYQFELINSFAKEDSLAYSLLGVDDLHVFPAFFHTILCLGVIYHRRDPLIALQRLRGALRHQGQLVLESLALPGDDPYALCPERYCKMRNAWFIPSEGCLKNWLEKSGFVDVQKINSHWTTADEQRRTTLSPGESLIDCLDPKDTSRTIEGYPAPLRVTYSARKID